MKHIDSFHHLAASARAADHDRYLCALFAPPGARAALFALILFNAEIARVVEVVSEPMLGQIRLQWWREAINEIYQGSVRKHEIVEPLARAVRRHNFTRSYFDRLIDAREMDLAAAPPGDMAALENYAEESAAPLISLSLEVMGADADALSELARHTGIGWALLGLMRALPHHAAQGRALLPGGIPAREEVPRIVETIGDMARQHIDKARALRRRAPRDVKRATLPAVLADAYLCRLAACGYDPYHPGSIIGPLRRQLLLSRSFFLGLS